MPKINLPPLRIPRKIEADRELRDYFYQRDRTLYDLFNAIADGDGTVIDDLEQSDIYDGQGASLNQLQDEFATIDDAESYFSGPRFVQFNPVTKNQDYTALDFDFVEAEKGVTVKLPAYPDDASEVIVANGDGSKITISGNGKKFNVAGLVSDVVVRQQGNSMHLQYFVDRGYWRIR